MTGEWTTERGERLRVHASIRGTVLVHVSEAFAPGSTVAGVKHAMVFLDGPARRELAAHLLALDDEIERRTAVTPQS